MSARDVEEYVRASLVDDDHVCPEVVLPVLERYSKALEEIASIGICQCDVAWTGRGLHQTDCLKWIGDIAREALAS